MRARTESDPTDWSEQAEISRMAQHLRNHSLPNAEEISTGGNCYAVRIPLSAWDDLNLTIAFGETWSWQIYRDGEQILAGTWSTPRIPKAAKRARRLVRALGRIVA